MVGIFVLLPKWFMFFLFVRRNSSKENVFFFLNMTQACFVCRAFFDAIEIISQIISIGMLTQISHLLFRLSFGCEHVLHVEPRHLDRVWKCWVLMRRKNRRTRWKTFENRVQNQPTQLACSVDSGRDHIDATAVLSLLLLELRHPVFIGRKIPTLKWVTNP